MTTFKILSIDGGGIRGIIPAFWLQRLEAELLNEAAKQKVPAKSVAETFDLFVGTSTGSIIAAALAIGKPAQEIVTLYDSYGSTIFPSSWMCNPLRYGHGTLRPAYSGRGLDEVLNEQLREASFSSVLDKKRLLITAFNGGRRTLELFDSDNPNDQQRRLADVVRASCAAPTYFPVKELEIDGRMRPMLDGGVAANNPASLALAKAFSLGHPPKSVLLLSLGTGLSQRPITKSQGEKRGWAQWARKIVDVMFDGGSDTNESLIRQILPAESYFRLQKYDLQTDPALWRATAKHLNALKDEADTHLQHESVQFKRLVTALTKQDVPVAFPLNGLWHSEYTWNSGATLEKATEEVSIEVFGARIAGHTTEQGNPYPHRFEGEFDGYELMGNFRSVPPRALRGFYVLTLDRNTLRTLNGHWIGTGNEVYSGTWKLIKK